MRKVPCSAVLVQLVELVGRSSWPCAALPCMRSKGLVLV